MTKPALGKLIALHTPIENGALSGDLPKRLKLLNWGANETKKGVVIVNATTLSALPQQQAAHGYDRIALDFAHNSVPGHPNYKADPREVAAYGVAQVVEGEGLFLDAIQWTPAGEKYARNYADLSPTPLLNEAREVTFIHSFALCPQGAVDGLSFFDAAPDAAAADSMPEIKKLLAAILGLDPETATEDQLLEAGKKHLETLTAAAENKKKEEEEAAKKAASAATTQEALSQRLDAIERKQLLTLAVQEGKVVPESLRDLPLEKLQAYIAEIKPTVPVERRTAAGLEPMSADQPGTMSATDKTVAAQLGISDADWNKK